MKFQKIGDKRATEQAEAAALKLKEEGILTCPNCGLAQFGEPRMFNMMFATQLGALEGAGSTVYLRPETAQGIFTNFKNILDTYHRKLPLGIAQIGKAFRNEITTGNSLFRVRELEQMEIEYFVKPGDDEAAFDMWLKEQEDFLVNDLGIERSNLREYEHAKEKLSHYSKKTIDFEYDYPFGGWGEMTGLANRTDFDLKSHQEASGRDLTYFDEVTRERFAPYVIEPTFGLGRTFLTVLIDAYREYPQGRDGQGTEMETVLHIAPQLAPVAVAVLPLMKKDGLPEKAREIFNAVRDILPNRLCVCEESGAIGKRYRKQDEIGTPYCITIDHQTLEDGTFTLRERDSMEQKRIAHKDLQAILNSLI
jgi:glycyl-tRNA synthetase